MASLTTGTHRRQDGSWAVWKQQAGDVLVLDEQLSVQRVFIDGAELTLTKLRGWVAADFPPFGTVTRMNAVSNSSLLVICGGSIVRPSNIKLHALSQRQAVAVMSVQVWRRM